MDVLRPNTYLTWKTQENINIDNYGHSATGNTKILDAHQVRQTYYLTFDQYLIRCLQKTI